MSERSVGYFVLCFGSCLSSFVSYYCSFLLSRTVVNFDGGLEPLQTPWSAGGQVQVCCTHSALPPSL